MLIANGPVFQTLSTKPQDIFETKSVLPDKLILNKTVNVKKMVFRMSFIVI